MLYLSNNPARDPFSAPTQDENTMSKTPWRTAAAIAIMAALGVGFGLSVTAQAKTQTPSNKTSKTEASTAISPELTAIKNAFELKFENSKVKAIRQMPFKDLYELQLNNKELVYTNAATEFVMVGHLISTQDMRNLTQERADELATIDFKSLPLAQSFALVKGDGSRHIAIFEDPNCGYCKLFRKTLEKANNITVHTFVIDILGDDSTAKAKKLLCTKDPAHAWDNWMLHGKPPEDSTDCDTRVLDKNRKLAAELGVTGTPTIFFENGSRAPGAVAEEEFQSLLIKASQK